MSEVVKFPVEKTKNPPVIHSVKEYVEFHLDKEFYYSAPADKRALMAMAVVEALDQYPAVLVTWKADS